MQAGATLIEILVTLLILSIGMLGMSALQARAIKGSVSSFQRSQAVIYGQYMLDVMRIDRESAKGGDYNTPKICSSSGITGTTLAKNSLREWLDSVRANVGSPGDTTTCVAVTCDADYRCTVKIYWDDSRSGGLSDQTMELATRV